MGPCPFRHGYRRLIRASLITGTRFNGAMPFQAWILSQGRRVDGAEHASMGPCPFRHGYAGTTRLVHLVRTASMGPCPFRHGYDLCSRSHARWHTRFNGAMPFQAWILGYPPAIATSVLVASMGPCPFRHGYFLYGSLAQFDCSASMGPCPFRHGYTKRVIGSQKTGWSFNGAMPFQAWIPMICRTT